MAVPLHKAQQTVGESNMSYFDVLFVILLRITPGIIPIVLKVVSLLFAVAWRVRPAAVRVIPLEKILGILDTKAGRSYTLGVIVECHVAWLQVTHLRDLRFYEPVHQRWKIGKADAIVGNSHTLRFVKVIWRPDVTPR
ncbi:hypothetical protein ElyMa_004794000 [Elysia marginata]|uniref:Uncharacterized protein n=1 Tax=Elysia marginata TaxID=1093978 RepID=A0AAV4IJK2_9GAST|nr:hypothetical protein ElyMa_004794000 [Elysia marginata]